MKANDFVKEYGLESAKNIIDGWIYQDFDDSYHIADGIYCNLPFEPTGDCGTLSLYDLKILVESHKLVESFGGMKNSIARKKGLKRLLKLIPTNLSVMSHLCKIENAIEDVESCQ